MPLLIQWTESEALCLRVVRPSVAASSSLSLFNYCRRQICSGYICAGTDVDWSQQVDGSLTRGGATSVRGRVRSPHISGGRLAAGSQRADSLGSQCAIA